MALKADHFITPIKLVLPGIIISLIGASAGYFLFNNPDEKKAKESYRNWTVIKEYEDAFKKGNEAFYCATDSLDQLKFRKDYAHLLDILINNLQDLKGNKEMDPRISAYLNIKISRYKESMKLTDTFLTQLEPMNNMLIKNPENLNLRQQATNLQYTYIKELAHVETRDDDELKRIAKALQDAHMKYTDSFLVQTEKMQPIDEIKNNIAAKWSFPEVQFIIEFKTDSTGEWHERGMVVPFNWTVKDTSLTINLPVQVFTFRLVKATPTGFAAYWVDREIFMVGCRRESSPVNK